MFFLDSTGFFSLVCLLIQSLLAWVFAGFFAALRRDPTFRLTCWRHAFTGLGVALTAVSVRYLMAHQHVADVDLVREGSLLSRGCYAIYLAGKLIFVGGLVAGIAVEGGGEQQYWPRRSRLLATGLAAALGAAVPTIEILILVQAPFLIAGMLRAGQLLRAVGGDPPGPGRRVVRGALVCWAAMWVVYASCAIGAGLPHPVAESLWIVPLRFNALIDLLLQVVLATGLIVIVMHDAQQATVAALAERDRLRELLKHDERMRAMGVLAAGVAHEINNPLTAILGFADDLLDADPAVRQVAARVTREQAERCRGILQRLATVGQQPRRTCEPVPIDGLVRRVVEGLTPQFIAARVELAVDVPPDLPPLVADRTGLEQVLSNLVVNALQASPPGARVRLQVAGGDGRICFRVDDQGSGVLPEHRERIFEPFWSTKPAGQGTGLGLAVAAALVKAHHGSIRVEDAPGGGATFVVDLPAAGTGAAFAPAAGADRQPAPRATAAAALRDPAAGPRPRLLVVDDEPMVRAIVARRVRALGWQVVDADRAEVALARLLDAGERFTAIICDLRMPGLGGIGLHDALAARAPELLDRLLLVTGALAGGEVEAFVRRCRCPILSKPFQFEDLLDRLCGLAGSHGHGAEAVGVARG